MYKVKASTTKGFVVNGITEDILYVMDKDKKLGTTPVGYVVVGMTGCALMCARGYYLKKGIKDILISADTIYEDKFTLNIHIDKVIDDVEIKEVIEYIKERCTVSKMLSKEIEYIIQGK